VVVGAPMTPRIAILGAGPVGLGAAYRLAELGHRDFTVYERNPYLGGLAASATDDAGFTYDVGGHVMFSHYEYFDRLVDRLLGDDFVQLMRESWIWMRHRWVPYPLQNNVRHLPAEVLLECLNGLIDVRAVDPGRAESFAEWIECQFGAGITRHFMRPYNLKVWAHPLEMMSKSWIAERVSVIELKRILANVIHQRDDAGWGPNNTFKYPLHGGTGGLYSRFEPYLRGHLQLSREVVEIDATARLLRFADGGEAAYDVLISAAPIPELLRMLRRVPESVVRASAGLHHSHGVVVGVGVAKPCGTTKCWTYFPEADCPFYRVTFLSNYSPNMAPPGHTLLLTETSWSAYRRIDAAGIVESVVDGLVSTGLLRDEDRARIVTTHTTEAEYFYPVPTLGRDRALAQIQPWLMARDIYSRGRFGAWKYEISNMDHCVMQGVEVVDSLLLGHPETTWKPEQPSFGGIRLQPGEGATVVR
jgi:protoporphyrinogen oxidase